MTKEQFKVKYEELINNCDFKSFLKSEGERLLISGGINKEDYSDDFILPRIILQAAIKNIHIGNREQDKKAIKNLSYF
jgi:hypothetical protein